MTRSWVARVLVTAALVAVAPTAGAAEDPLALVKRGEFTRALPILQAAATSRPADGVTRYHLGFCLLGLQRWPEAEVEFERAVAVEPTRHSWLHALAKAQLEQGKNREAIATVERAQALAPLPEYFFAAAVAATNLGDSVRAEPSLARVIAARPRDPEALYLLARIHANRGEDQEALGLLRRCLDADPRHLEARYRKGLAESKVGDPAIGVADFEAVVTAVPGHVGALYNLGQTLLRLGQREAGKRRLEEFKRASALEDQVRFIEEFVKLDPRNLDKRLQLARLQLEAGAANDALTTLTAARLLDPTHRPTIELLRATLARLGRQTEAEALAQLLRDPRATTP